MKTKSTNKKKEKFEITLEYKGVIYKVNEVWEENYGWGTKDEGIRYMYEEGNYSCDCNRSLFIKRQCDPKFEEMKCGDKIMLISIKKA